MRQLVYVPDQLAPLFDEAKAHAADEGRSFSEVVVRLVAGYVLNARTSPVPVPQRAFHALVNAANTAGMEGPCDVCGKDGGLLRGSVDLTGTTTPAMTLERLCGTCRV